MNGINNLENFARRFADLECSPRGDIAYKFLVTKIMTESWIIIFIKLSLCILAQDSPNKRVAIMVRC